MMVIITFSILLEGYTNLLAQSLYKKQQELFSFLLRDPKKHKEDWKVGKFDTMVSV